jgi:hypothetical protein
MNNPMGYGPPPGMQAPMPQQPQQMQQMPPQQMQMQMPMPQMPPRPPELSIEQIKHLLMRLKALQAAK